MAVTSTADLAARAIAYSPDVPIFTHPIAGNTISGLAGIKIPIIGNSTPGAIATGFLNTISPEASQAVSIASIVANLPPTLFRRPEGPILVGNLAANMALVQSRVRHDRIMQNGSLLDKSTLDQDSNSKQSPYSANSTAQGPEIRSSLSKLFTGELVSNPAGPYVPGGLLVGTDYNKLFYNQDSRAKYSVLSYDQIQERARKSAEGTPLEDFRTELRQEDRFPTYTDDNTKQVLETFEYRSREELKQGSPLTDDEVVDSMMVEPAGVTKDFVKLLFTDKRTDEQYQFRSYIVNFSDKWSPEFNGISYIGRPNKLKLFTETSRELSLEFLVPALSRGEMKYMYKKLQFLAKLTLPTGLGAMTGPVMEFTIGDLVENELCHLTSLSFDIEPDYSWEVNLEGNFVELPHIIKVSMGIYIIGNTVMNTDSYQIFGTAANKEISRT